MSIHRVTGTDAKNLGLDELVANDAFIHIERMSNTTIWLSVECKGQRISLWLDAKAKIHVTHEWQSRRHADERSKSNRTGPKA